LKNSLYQIKESASLIEDIRSFNEINLKSHRLKKLNIDTYLKTSIEMISEQFSGFDIIVDVQDIIDKHYTLAGENLTELFYHILFNSLTFIKTKQKKIVIKLESKTIEGSLHWLYKILIFGADFPNEVMKYLRQNQPMTNKDNFDDTFIRIMKKNNTYNNRIGLRFSIINNLAIKYKTKLWIDDFIDDDEPTNSCTIFNLAFPQM